VKDFDLITLLAYPSFLDDKSNKESIMYLKATWFRDKLKKKAKQGFQGYPIATIVYYGPDDKVAIKVSVSIILDDGNEVAYLERWFNEKIDTRLDPLVNEGIIHFLAQHGAKSVVMADRIFGCPHEEGVDYPEGEKCQKCSYWAIRDRFTREVIQ
jgi:hypothetical protein